LGEGCWNFRGELAGINWGVSWCKNCLHFCSEADIELYLAHKLLSKLPSIAVHIESPIPLEVKRLEVELWEKEDNAKIVFVKGLYPFFDAVCLFWIGEIHIDERYKDSKTLDDLVKHELMHYKLIKRARKYIEEGKILKAFAFAILNGIFDIYDTLRIELKELILKCRKK